MFGGGKLEHIQRGGYEGAAAAALYASRAGPHRPIMLAELWILGEWTGGP